MDIFIFCYIRREAVPDQSFQIIFINFEFVAERCKSISAVVWRMYYIGGMSFFKISCVLGKSERNIQDIHRKAIKQIEGENID